MTTLIRGGHIVNEGKVFDGALIIDGERISDVLLSEETLSDSSFDRVIDATGCYVLPGIIDSHVHFRDPGLTEKADMETESCAAAAGGITSFFDMPNTVPQTTTLEAMDEKFNIAAQKSLVNYSFFFGATNDNTHIFPLLDPHRIPGIKLFMGSSTGNMLVDNTEALDRIFSSARLPIMAHCEDTAIINQNMTDFKARYGDDPPVWAHQLIRSEEACMSSTTKAIELAVGHQARLHIAHVSTEAELELLPPLTSQLSPLITAEATVGHLLFSTIDYERLGTRIKVNPAIKSVVDQEALRQGLRDGRISTIATDHAPHLLSQKQGGSARAASGMPMIQFSLVSMLELVDEGVLTIERMVELMAHNPAHIFEVRQRGFLRKGYQADVVVVRPNVPWTLTPDIILSKCGWSPLEGHEFRWRVETTLCNGYPVYQNGQIDDSCHGQPIMFR